MQQKQYTSNQIINSYRFLEQILNFGFDELKKTYFNNSIGLIENIVIAINKEPGFFAFYGKTTAVLAQLIDYLEDKPNITNQQRAKAIYAYNLVKPISLEQTRADAEQYYFKEVSIRNELFNCRNKLEEYMTYDAFVARKLIDSEEIQTYPRLYISSLLKTIEDIPEIYSDDQWFDFNRTQLQSLTKKKVFGIATKPARKAEYALAKLEYLKR